MDNEPWWNDGEKVGGFAATVCILLILAIMIVGFIWFVRLVLF